MLILCMTVMLGLNFVALGCILAVLCNIMSTLRRVHRSLEGRQ